MNSLCALILSLALQQPAEKPAEPVPTPASRPASAQYMPAIAKPENPDYKYLIYIETEQDRKEKMRSYSI